MFFLERANYYNAVSFNDSVYRTIKVFTENENYIPRYDTIIIDEYQDFNNLEAKLLEFLSAQCLNILIAGDDDQSVYSFKYTSPEHIREKYINPMFSNFELPYCSRCSKVIVDAVKNVINKATKEGILSDRIKKKYTCHIQSKNKDNIKYPYIQKVNISVNTKKAPYFAKYILSVLNGLDDDDVIDAQKNAYPLALVIGPKHYLNQIENSFSDPTDEYSVLNTTRKIVETPIISAMAHLYKNDKSNLGWRIILQEIGDSKLIKDAITKTKSGVSLIIEHIPMSIQNTWLSILEILKQEYSNQNYLSETENLIEKLGENYMRKFIISLQRDEISEEVATLEKLDESKLSEIILTTYSGSKGLSAGQVFIVGLEEGLFPISETPSFDEICQFIVSLTRARKQCHLLSVSNFLGSWHKKSQFLQWIDDNNLHDVHVNKDYFQT